MNIACIVIASRHRRELLDSLVMPSVVGQSFEEIVVVGDYHSGPGYRHLPFPPLTGSTIDGQFKRDMGTLATSAEYCVYLCDDHRLDLDFCCNLRAYLPDLGAGSIGVPTRFTQRGDEIIGLNMGVPGYCGGHCGVFHRTAIQQVPWALAPWHPNWDFYHSRILIERGYQLIELPDCRIEDVDPTGEPWL